MMEFGNQFESSTACEATTEVGSAARTAATLTGDDAQSTVETGCRRTIRGIKS